jgi:hypothetical protein
VCGGGKRDEEGLGCPVEADHCLMEPSAEMDIVVSAAVHAMPQTASLCAAGLCEHIN